jgi:hypothetical protein
MLTKAGESPVTSTNLSVAYLDLKTDRMQNEFMHVKSDERYRHHMQVIMEYHYLDKGR